jgi:hypothetical protein
LRARIIGLRVCGWSSLHLSLAQIRISPRRRRVDFEVDKEVKRSTRAVGTLFYNTIGITNERGWPASGGAQTEFRTSDLPVSLLFSGQLHVHTVHTIQKR